MLAMLMLSLLSGVSASLLARLRACGPGPHALHTLTEGACTHLCLFNHHPFPPHSTLYELNSCYQCCVRALCRLSARRCPRLRLILIYLVSPPPR